MSLYKSIPHTFRKAASDELGLIFHRYLSKNQFSRNKQLEIFVNGEVLSSLDPFKTDHPATQQLETEEIEQPTKKPQQVEFFFHFL